MQCMECGRTAAQSDGVCSLCEQGGKRELDELLGDTPSERWQVGAKTVDVKGLPPRMRLEDTNAGHHDKPVADSVLYAPDAQREFTIRYGAAG